MLNFIEKLPIQNRLNHFPINFKITKYDWRIYTKSKKEKVKPQT